jgi:hypothetical protein
MITLALLAAVHASPTDLYGFGGRTIGRAGAGVSLVADPDAAMLNPAGLGRLTVPEVGAGFSFVRVDLAKLPPVWWDTNRDGLVNDTDEPLDPGPFVDAADTFLMSMSRPILPWWGVGASFLLPKDRLLRFETFESSLPSYFMYENRLHRYDIAMGTGILLPGGFTLGAGVRWMGKAKLHLGFVVDGTVSGDELSTADGLSGEVVDLTIDAQTIRVDLGTTAVPTLGFQWVAPEDTPLHGLAAGASWHGSGGLPVEVTVDGQLNLGAEDLADLEPILLALLTDLSVSIMEHYLPSQLQMGVSWSIGETLDMVADVRHTRWKGMITNVAHMEDASLDVGLADLSETPVKDGNPMDPEFKNTWGLRLGAEMRFPYWDLPWQLGTMRTHLRGGFGYEPTPLVSQTPDSALLDSDRILFACGLGAEHASPLTLIDGPFRWDGFFQVHTLARGELDRGAPPVPTAGYPVDGGTYPIGGRILVGGIQWGATY